METLYIKTYREFGPEDNWGWPDDVLGREPKKPLIFILKVTDEGIVAINKRPDPEHPISEWDWFIGVVNSKESDLHKWDVNVMLPEEVFLEML